MPIDIISEILTNGRCYNGGVSAADFRQQFFLDKAHPAKYTLTRQVIRDPFVSRKAQAGFVIFGLPLELPLYI